MRFLAQLTCFAVLLTPAVCHATFDHLAPVGGGSGAGTPITFEELIGVFGTIEADILPDVDLEFGFQPAATPPETFVGTPDGDVLSAVLSNGDGLFAYLYQIQNTGPHFDDDVSRMIVDWSKSAFHETTIASKTNQVFEISTLGDSSSFATDIGTLAGRFDFYPDRTIQETSQVSGPDFGVLTTTYGSSGFEENIETDESSAIVVVFSTLRPTTTTPEMDDGINKFVLKPLVYTPAPEPMQMVHLLSATLALGLGLLCFRSRRRATA